MIDLFLLAAAAGAAPKPQELKIFSDWIVGCDNLRSCQANALMPVDDVEGTTMVIRRGGEALARPNISINVNNGDAAALAVDGRQLPVRITSKDGAIEVDRNQSVALIDAMRAGRTMTVRDARGKVIGTPSLSGVSAALLYMDEQQKRLGTVTALVRKGAKPASAVPVPPSPPVIVSPKAPKLVPRRLTRADIARETKSLECEANAEVSIEPTYARLDAQTSFALLPFPCGNGAYNLFAYVLLIDNAGKVSAARFDSQPGMGEGIDNTIVNGDWDAQKRLLSTYSKGRGLGDCGAISNFAWDGERFRLSELQMMGECRGSVDYVTVWRTTVR